jgi:hypothetical protein
MKQRPRRRVHRASDARGALEQVGPSDVADEDEIAGDGGERLGCRLRVGDQKRDVLRGVSGRMHHIDAHAADRERIAVLKQHGVGGLGERIAPVRTAFVGQQQRGTGFGGELATARQVVGVDVGLRDVRDANALFSGGAKVLIDVAIGVDHHGVAGVHRADEITRLGELGVVEASNQHH